ncbi:hypothetical protein J8I87_33000 [Paraburkholderia sp. LEh10]|uniref:hypothetical protein n=1 Tax=Paraburkholderia sp. LEh10 TaxID=2821353 RepID=UPI001AE169E8|nr:hypothetical protein [Paraburkholderia sp. LEh10]MBP0594400.1 hypothetical protein [Paraburkholderia sp. LEh10]
MQKAREFQINLDLESTFTDVRRRASGGRPSRNGRIAAFFDCLPTREADVYIQVIGMERGAAGRDTAVAARPPPCEKHARKTASALVESPYRFLQDLSCIDKLTRLHFVEIV